jgi:serine/threonine protein kinase
MAAIGGLIGFVIVYCYLGYRRRKSDEVWHVNPEELDFSHPVEVIGQGAFGVVLAAEYRGTRVAIKRVIPQQDVMRTRASSVPSVPGSVVSGSNNSQDLSKGGPSDLEAGADSPGTIPTTGDSRESAPSDSNLSDILVLPIDRKRSRLSKWMPFQDTMSRSKLTILGNASGGSTSHKSLHSRLLYRCDETYQRQQEFKAEMRLLSRLRHPCECRVQLLLLFAFHSLLTYFLSSLLLQVSQR